MNKKNKLLYSIIALLFIQIILYIHKNYFTHVIELHDTTTIVPDLEINQSFDHVKTIIPNSTFTSKSPEERKNDWKKSFFSPWHNEIRDLNLNKQKEDLADIFSQSPQQKMENFFNQTLYRENYREINEQDRKNLINNLNFETFKTIDQPGITIQRTKIKGAPIEFPLFCNPQKAGEGYPFDNIQYHQLPPAQPIRISHYSKDGLWAYIATNQNFDGWVPTHHILQINKTECTNLFQSQWGMFVKDNIIIKDESNKAICKSSVGMHLPISKDKTIYFPTIHKGKTGEILRFIKIQIDDQDSFSLQHLPWSVENAKKILTPLLDTVYGWGTLYGERDCSALVQDYASVFGIWLGRNSKIQSTSGSMTFDCSEMNNEQKMQLIREKAIPFKTLFYRTGHIGIFIGFDKQNQPLMMHSVWGIKTKYAQQKGRYIIGKSIISHLNYGHSHPIYDQEEDFLKLMSKITILDF